MDTDKESEFHKNVLQMARQRLVDDMDPVPVLDHLLEILPKASVRDIKELPSTSDKNRKIIDCFHSKDLHAYNKFKEYLTKTQQDNLVVYLLSLEPNKRTFKTFVSSVPPDKNFENDIENAFNNNPYEMELYKEIIKDGKEEVEDHLIRIMIIGCNGQGKTTLARHLIGQSIRTFESTDGISMLDKPCYVLENGIWEFVDCNKDNDTTINHDEVKIPDDEFTKNTTNKGSLCRISVWDFGGNFLSYSTQQMFLIRNAIYLLVFDLSKDLQSVHRDGVTDDNKTLEFWIRFWVNSIHSFAGSENGIDPCILLVGTHQDKIKGKTISIFDKVRSLFLGTPLAYHIYKEEFAVNNNDISSDSSISSLKEHIIKVAEERIQKSCIPKRWIPLKIAIIQRKNDNILTLTEVLIIAKEQKDSIEDLEEVKLFLKYFHEQGLFYYFDENGLKDLVVVNPKFLMDAFRCIIAANKSQLRQPALSPWWTKLATEAKLHDNLLQCVWDETYMKHKKEILNFLEKHRIVSKPVNDMEDHLTSCSDFYFVPSFLKADVTFQVHSFRNEKCGSKVSLVYKFASDVIVQTIYQRVTAAALSQWPLVIYAGKQLIFLDTGVYKISENHVGIIKMNIDELELLVVKLCTDDNTELLAKPCEAFRRYVTRRIDYEFHKIGHLQYKTEMPFRTYIRCNHEKHEYRGSLVLHDVDIIKSKTHCVCPDNQSHSIYVEEALSEWFLDIQFSSNAVSKLPKAKQTHATVRESESFGSLPHRDVFKHTAQGMLNLSKTIIQGAKYLNIQSVVDERQSININRQTERPKLTNKSSNFLQGFHSCHNVNQCSNTVYEANPGFLYSLGGTNKNISEAEQESSGKLSKKDLAIVAQLVKSNGSVLRLQLGLRERSVKRIQREFKGEVMQIYQMLLEWEKKENVTLDHLCSLLRNCNEFITIDWDGIRNLMDDKKNMPRNIIFRIDKM